MNEELQNALVAAKSGDEEEARLILAEFLRREPDNVPAWVLLSKLAASDVQKAAFLRKVLNLDPHHAYARQALQELGQAPPPVITNVSRSQPEPASQVQPLQEASTDEASASFDYEEEMYFAEEEVELEPESDLPDSEDPGDLSAQEDDEPIPPWVDVDETMFDRPQRPAMTEAADESEDELPEWLMDEGDEGGDEWLDEVTEAHYTDSATQPSDPEEAGASEKAARLEAAMAAQKPAVGAAPDSDSSRGWLLPLLLIVAAVIFLALVYAILFYFM